MNTQEIDRFLRQRLPDFDGVFSIDTLPERPRLLVCNTDPSDEPGRHWVAICVREGRGECFDSFGRAPNAIFARYLNCVYWTFNDRRLQSIVSRFCGHYCIYYCMLSSRGIDMRRIVSSLTSDTGLNDVLLHGFVCRSQ